MKQIIIINRKLSVSEIQEIKLSANNGSEIFMIEKNQDFEFAKQISLNNEEKKKVNYETLSEVIGFGDISVDGTTFSDLFRIGQASVWHYQKFRVYFLVRNLMYFFKLVELKFGNYKNHTWFVSDEFKPVTEIFEEVVFRFPEQKTKAKYNFKDLFLFAATLKYRLFSYYFNSRKSPEHLIYVSEKFSNILDKNTLKIRKGHHVLEYLFAETDKRFALLTEVLLPKPKGKSDYTFAFNQLKSKWNSNRKIFIEGVLLSGLISNDVRKSINNAKIILANSYSKLHLEDFNLIQKIAFLQFRSLNKTSVFYLSRYFAARKYFSNSGIKSIVATDENSPLTKSILDAAKSHGIKTIGIQHGTMHDLHPAYIYTKNDRENNIMPDLTLTWGKYWEDFLIYKGNYPHGSVKSVGQLRTDLIPELLKRESEKNENDSKILFASQPQRDPELRYRAAFDVFKAISIIENVILIVRLHPREFSDAGYYEAIANDVGCINYVFDYKSDLYELIASCEIVVTCFSTVGTETVYFHKPLVILDHLRQDIAGYAAEKVAFTAIDSESLKSTIIAILDGSIMPDCLTQDIFIEKYANVIDGKVAKRCIEAIISA